MDIPITENVILENRPERQIVVNPRQRTEQDDYYQKDNYHQQDDHYQWQDHHHTRQDHHRRQDHQPRQKLTPEEEKYNNEWNGRRFIIFNSIYKTRCSFCANVKEFCEFKKGGNVSEIVPFQNQFRCRKCYKMHDRTDMIVVKRCFHVFGKKCLAESVNVSDGGQVHCPAKLKTVCHTIFSVSVFFFKLNFLLDTNGIVNSYWNSLSVKIQSVNKINVSDVLIQNLLSFDCKGVDHSTNVY